MNISEIAKRAGKLVTDNSPTILTAIGVTGALTTAYLTGEASFKAAQLIEFEESQQHAVLNTKEKVSMVWPEFVPAVVTGLVTVTAIIFANRIGMRRAAAIAAAYNLSEKAFSEYKDKIVERLGHAKATEVKDAIAQDKVNQNPVSTGQVLVTGGSVLCFEAYTGRYFFSDIETLKQAQNNINYKVLNNYYASLTDFYDEIGLPPTSVSDELGWNSDKLLELEFSAVISEDRKPCIVINYIVTPVRGYSRIN